MKAEIKTRAILGLLVALLSACDGAEVSRDAPEGSGSLLIVGGALRSDNTAVYRAFIDAIPAQFPEIAIVPVASGRPAYYAQQFTADLRRHGFNGDIRILPIAMVDDPSTDAEDESLWRSGGGDLALAASLSEVGGIWFVGGDQTRITTALYAENNMETPVLQAIRRQLSRGAVIGGTSAGAAIMSRTMIAAGDALSALTMPPTDQYVGMESQESGQLMLSQGLGFLPVGVVDQHFDRKARLGRLVRTLALVGDTAGRLGFGVDEDTAVLVDLASAEMTVLGAGNLVFADGRGAVFSDGEQAFAARGLQLSVLSAGDTYNWRTNRYGLSGGETQQREAFGYKVIHGAGMALGNPRLDQLLGFSLLDNTEARELRRITFDEESGKGVLFRFRQTDESRGYWRYSSGTKDQYSVVGVELEIAPVSVSVSSRP
ncbi:cyanophycinase [Microbulbifer sp. SH-1]|uniref:cyanophycinase n=1 Tax=Microbulbifer sp. SH-1 TaxID=2681547 RepID=UPI00140D4EDE|nr:cyanophycinase [Microbulbifer sp. SH-1]QIL88910.1 cyanophycinase [Microbulbifer sp. SH-1]